MLHEWDDVVGRSAAEGRGQVEWQRSGPGLPSSGVGATPAIGVITPDFYWDKNGVKSGLNRVRSTANYPNQVLFDPNEELSGPRLGPSLRMPASARRLAAAGWIKGSGRQQLYEDQVPELLAARLARQTKVESITASNAIEGVEVDPGSRGGSL